MKSSPVVRVAVIGAGGIGHHHIAGFQQHPDARVVAIAETHPERGAEAAKKFAVPEVVADWRALLRRDDIDAVSVALPNFLHAPVTLAFLRAGKHVMLDKPMATHAGEAVALVAAAKKGKRVLMVGQNQRFTPGMQTLKHHVTEGTLGEVYHAKAFWRRRSGIPRIGSWFTQKEFAGGGCTYDIGAHVLDQALFLLGEFDAAAVSGQTFAQFGPRGRGDGSWGKSEVDPKKPFDVEDLAVALIKLRSGRTVLLEVSWAAHQADHDLNGVQIFGTEAGATSTPLQLFRQGRGGYTVEQLDVLPPKVNPDRMVHFTDVVLGRAAPYVRPEESLGVQRILDAIYRSAATGREVRLAKRG